jgi:hypothetical protein
MVDEARVRQCLSDDARPFRLEDGRFWLNGKTVAGERSRCVVGLGQKRDYSERVYVERDPVTWERHRDTKARLGYLERVSLGTLYPDGVKHVGGVLIGGCDGCGRTGVDLLRRDKLRAR